MGRHDKHLPRRKHLNKACDPTDPRTGRTASSKTLQRVARGQGTGTKEDAKAAKAGKK